MADQMSQSLVRDSASGAIVVLGPGGIAATGGRTLGTLVKTDANFVTASASQVAIPGLTLLSFTAGSRPVFVEFTMPGGMSNNTAGDYAVATLKLDSAGPNTQIGQIPYQSAVANANSGNILLRVFLNTLTPGTTHTLDVTGVVLIGGTATYVFSADQPGILTVRET